MRQMVLVPCVFQEPMTQRSYVICPRSHSQERKAGIWTWVCLPSPSLFFIQGPVLLQKVCENGREKSTWMPSWHRHFCVFFQSVFISKGFFSLFLREAHEIRYWYENPWRPPSYQDTLHLGATRVRCSSLYLRLTFSNAGFQICLYQVVNHLFRQRASTWEIKAMVTELTEAYSQWVILSITTCLNPHNIHESAHYDPHFFRGTEKSNDWPRSPWACGRGRSQATPCASSSNHNLELRPGLLWIILGACATLTPTPAMDYKNLNQRPLCCWRSPPALLQPRHFLSRGRICANKNKCHFTVLSINLLVTFNKNVWP